MFSNVLEAIQGVTKNVSWVMGSSVAAAPELFQGASIDYRLVASNSDYWHYATYHSTDNDEDTTTTVPEDKPMTVAEWSQHLATSNEACLQLTSLIRNCPFSAVRWETRGVTYETWHDVSMEFVLVRDDGLYGFAQYADSHAFAEHFTKSKQCVITEDDDNVDNNGHNPHAVVFANIGQTATLVAPLPLDETGKNSYGHLANFLRQASDAQITGVWQTVALAYQDALQAQSPRPVWLSTAGTGVRWLHFRLDQRPKYYHHKPFRVQAMVPGM